jgi:hypothetical protein
MKDSGVWLLPQIVGYRLVTFLDAQSTTAPLATMERRVLPRWCKDAWLDNRV